MTKIIPIRLKPQEFEGKWQEKWEKEGIYSPDFGMHQSVHPSDRKPYYNLMMFPYPSAEGLHVGNMYAFTGVDVAGRFKRMQGYDVFEPIGLDGFGIHSENYALKVNKHPKEQAKISANNFYRQLRAIGNGFDFRHTLETYDPDYYRWTQWLFVQMFKNGLAYRAKASVNYCPSCKTVLADEQVVKENQNAKIKMQNDNSKFKNISDNQKLNQRKSIEDDKTISTKDVCERCGTEVVMKELEQWFFKITEYAEKLLQNTYKPQFNWSDKVKIGQQKWIGKKEGINIKYQILDSKTIRREDSKMIEVFTTRPDTNFGATFIVIAPEHDLAEKISTKEHIQNVKKYIEVSKKKSKEERIAEGKKKTGVFTGAYVINNLNNYKMPIYISDFVLMEFGTGAVVGVPGHDKRDFEFAQEFDLPIVRVVVGEDNDKSDITKIEQVQEETGTMINSEFLNGLNIHDATHKIMDYLEEKGWGKRVTTYHLRDWLISRQRYWGAPIPIIYCEKCQWQPVPEDQLPVLLPDVEDWRPTGTGRGPLAAHPEFYNTTCPNCKGKAVRETDVCDTFLDSAWYYLRYPFTKSKKAVADENLLDPQLDRDQKQVDHKGIVLPRMRSAQNSSTPAFLNNLPWDNEITKNWFPIDMYIGGAEHTVLHLLYTRFVYMALIDWGLLKAKKPTQADNFIENEPFKRFYAHGLIIKDGAKMSKSKGNVVIPDEYIKLYGADTLRTYLMFLGPFDSGGDFRDTGIAGMYKWLSRVWRLISDSASTDSFNSNTASQEGQKRIHALIKFVTQELTNLRYNTAIAKMMEFTNWWMDHSGEVDQTITKDFIKLLAPFAPYMCEELYQRMILQNTKYQIPNTKFMSVHQAKWPEFNEKLLVENRLKIIIQINGKTRDLIDIETKLANDQKQVEQLVLKSARSSRWLQNAQIKKTIFIPKKLINFVI